MVKAPPFPPPPRKGDWHPGAMVRVRPFPPPQGEGDWHPGADIVTDLLGVRSA